MVGCGGLPFDNSPPPIRNGLNTLELHYEGSMDLGLMGGYFYEDKHGTLSFPLFNEGSFEIVSNRCQFSRSESFDVSSWSMKSFNTKELTQNMPNDEVACIFNIVLFVEGMDYGMQGIFTLVRGENDLVPIMSNLSNREYPSGISWLQARENSSTNVPVTFDLDGSGTAFFIGCGKTDEKRFEGNFETTLEWFSGGDQLQPCVYEIGFEFDDGRLGINTLVLSTFSDRVVALRDPSLSMGRRDRLTAESSDPVVYIAINNSYKKGDRIRERLGSSNEIAYVRIITANGRYGLYKVQKGQIIWRPSVHF